MKNFILYLLLTVATVSVMPAYAAFPVDAQAEENVSNVSVVPAEMAGTNSMQFAPTPAPAPAPSAPGMGGPGLSIAALVLGIVAVLTSAWTLAIIAGALAIIFGAMNLRGPKPGMALAGLILGIVGVALALIDPWGI